MTALRALGLERLKYMLMNAWEGSFKRKEVEKVMEPVTAQILNEFGETDALIYIKSTLRASFNPPSNMNAKTVRTLVGNSRLQNVEINAPNGQTARISLGFGGKDTLCYTLWIGNYKIDLEEGHVMDEDSDLDYFAYADEDEGFTKPVKDMLDTVITALDLQHAQKKLMKPAA